MKLSLLMAMMIVAGIPLVAYGEVLEVATSQSIYSYGDFLSFTVTVDRVTQDGASFRIIDQDGIASSSLPMAISDVKTTVTAPNPFTSIQFKKQGTYTISVEYDGARADTEFQLVDSGKIVIPFWIKDVARLWLDGIIDDTAYLKNLMDNGTITPEQALDGDAMTSVPTVARILSIAWVQGLISDHEYALGMQYLVDKNVITVGR